MDSKGIIADWNAKAEATFGWPREQVLGRTLSETIVPAQHRAAHERGFRHFLKTGEGRALNKRIEITALHRDGHEFPIDSTVSAITWGESFLFSAAIRDITERKRFEQGLHAAKEAAEVAIRRRARFWQR